MQGGCSTQIYEVFELDRRICVCTYIVNDLAPRQVTLRGGKLAVAHDKLLPPPRGCGVGIQGKVYFLFRRRGSLP